MSFAEKFVSVAGGGLHDGSSEANAWSLSEAVTGYALGDRLNIKSGAYSSGAIAPTVDGDSAQQIVWRGYNTVIGDLEGQGRSSDGSLNTANFPTLTFTGTFTLSNQTLLQNLIITGAINGELISGSSTDYSHVLECKVENTSSSSGAIVLRCDDNCSVVDSDVICSGTTHSYVLQMDIGCVISGNRIIGRSTGSTSLVVTRSTSIVDNIFIGGGDTPAINVSSLTIATLISGNTFYNCGDIVQTPNSSSAGMCILRNNHATDSSGWMNNQYSATANKSFIETHNRTRDIATLRTGVGDGCNIAEVTTDTGGAATDYTDAPNDDLSLINGAPGVDTGVGIGSWNIGSQQDGRSAAPSEGGRRNRGKYNGGAM